MDACSTQRKIDRSVDELVGVCRGIIADGFIVDAEAKFLRSWLDSHHVLRAVPEAILLLNRLATALEDGVIDADEEAAILASILEVARPEPPEGQSQARRENPLAGTASASVHKLPYDDPANFHPAGTSIVLTGVFVEGSKADVIRVLEAHGGRIGNAVSGRTDYVIVGALGSADWLSSSGGTKIRAAIELKERGNPVRLVSEAHMRAFLDRNGR